MLYILPYVVSQITLCMLFCPLQIKFFGRPSECQNVCEGYQQAIGKELAVDIKIAVFT